MISSSKPPFKWSDLKYKKGDHVLYRPLPTAKSFSSGIITSNYYGPFKKTTKRKNPFAKKRAPRKPEDSKPYFGICNDNTKKITFYTLESIVGHVDETTKAADDADGN
ncbi:hypothetical protein BC940DRAFT_333099 [Gongronella butleri]|nr:hypothetical protein BC940DRAFT_333099 [Gongronella butleri]